MAQSQRPPHKCIFCLSSAGPFTSAEHVIPESLGNEEVTLAPGWVCDGCNQYFGLEIESKALHSFDFAFWRCSLAVRTKKGKMPLVEFGGGIRMGVDENGEPSMWFDPKEEYSRREPERISAMRPGDTGVFRVPALSRRVLTRFLGKIGLELVAMGAREESPFDSRYDALRRYVRRGDNIEKWPAGHASLPLDEMWRPGKGPGAEDATLYSYGVALPRTGSDVIFAFEYGPNVWAMYLTRPEVDAALLGCLQNVSLHSV